MIRNNRLAGCDVLTKVDLPEFGRPTMATRIGFSVCSASPSSAGADIPVAFGKAFLANPDLPERFRTGAALNAPNPATFYARGAEGYTDYPALEAAEA